MPKLPTVTLDDILGWDRCYQWPDEFVMKVWGRRCKPVNALEIIDAVLKHQGDIDGDLPETNALWAALHVVPEAVGKELAEEWTVLNYHSRAKFIFWSLVEDSVEAIEDLVTLLRRYEAS